MDVFTLALGDAGAAGAYFVYLAATKGGTAAIAWAKARWNAGKADLAALQADVTGAKDKVTALETGAVADLQKAVASLRGDVDKVTQYLSPGVHTVNLAPAFLAPTAPAPAAPNA